MYSPNGSRVSLFLEEVLFFLLCPIWDTGPIAVPRLSHVILVPELLLRSQPRVFNSHQFLPFSTFARWLLGWRRRCAWSGRGRGGRFRRWGRSWRGHSCRRWRRGSGVEWINEKGYHKESGLVYLGFGDWYFDFGIGTVVQSWPESPDRMLDDVETIMEEGRNKVYVALLFKLTFKKEVQTRKLTIKNILCFGLWIFYRRCLNINNPTFPNSMSAAHQA